jgi:hypothetical protein
MEMPSLPNKPITAGGSSAPKSDQPVKHDPHTHQHHHQQLVYAAKTSTPNQWNRFWPPREIRGQNPQP